MQRLLGAVPVLFFASGAWAADAGGSLWDDHHMQSNFAVRQHLDATRPPIQIGDASTGATQVRERVLAISPHAWQPGVATFGSNRPGSSAGSFSSPSGPHASGGSQVRSPSWSQGLRRSSAR